MERGRRELTDFCYFLLLDISFQVPFPLVAFCPDLDRFLLQEYFKCIFENNCDVISKAEAMQRMATVRACSFVCVEEALQHIDRRFLHELTLSDHKNMTLADHLEYFLDPSWTEKHSFCNSVQLGDGRIESYATVAGLCFILNPGDGIFKKQRCVFRTDYTYN